MAERPSVLTTLVRWYVEELEDAIPARIHSRDIDEGGAPAWHGAFRAWLTAHPAAEDREGRLISPLRYWVWRMPQRRSRFLLRLAAWGGDWREAASVGLILDEDAQHDYTKETLRRLHRLMYADDGTAREPVRLKLGDCARPGCDVRTPRLYCDSHAIRP